MPVCPLPIQRPISSPIESPAQDPSRSGGRSLLSAQATPKLISHFGETFRSVTRRLLLLLRKASNAPRRHSPRSIQSHADFRGKVVAHFDRGENPTLVHVRPVQVRSSAGLKAKYQRPAVLSIIGRISQVHVSSNIRSLIANLGRKAEPTEDASIGRADARTDVVATTARRGVLFAGKT